jgi:lipoprotein-anchoring transpeptidase ErfK/SrfK
MDDPHPHQRRVRRRPLLAGMVALIPAIPIVIALLLSSGPTTASPAAAALYRPVPARTPKSVNTLVPPGRGALVALVGRPTKMRSSPGGHAYARVKTRTEFGSPEAMWVVRMSGPWLGVVSPLAGNGKVGWIPARAASLSRVAWQLRVNLSQRQLAVLDNGRIKARYTIAVGSPEAPTPTGRFSVTDRLRTGDPAGPYGCCILALSAKAPHAISDWDGGNRIAIHSTTEAWSIGKPLSHGCMRLTLAEGRWLLAHVPLGTPTRISA